jgi:hypothetical protein
MLIDFNRVELEYILWDYNNKYHMKTNTTLLLLFIVVSTLAKLQTCITDLKTAKITFQTVVNKFNQNQNLNNLVEDLAIITKTIPTTMEDCGDKSGANIFRQELPDICIDDMEKALKIGMKLLNGTDNDIKFAIGNNLVYIDMALLERLF